MCFFFFPRFAARNEFDEEVSTFVSLGLLYNFLDLLKLNFFVHLDFLDFEFGILQTLGGEIRPLHVLPQVSICLIFFFWVEGGICSF